MDAKELRATIRQAHIPSSALSYASGTQIGHVMQFVDGDDTALSDEELESIRQSLRVPDDDVVDKNLTTNATMMSGLGDALGRHSIAITLESRNGTFEIASGTLVRIGEHVLIATARHVLRPTRMLNIVGGNQVAFAGKLVEGEQTGISDLSGGTNVEILRTGRSQLCDVGFLEIHPSALDLLERQPITIDRISVGTPQFGRNTFIYAFPYDATDFLKVETKLVAVPMCSITLGTPLLDPAEWPEVSENDPDPNVNVDLFVHYSVTEEMIRTFSGQAERGDESGRHPATLPRAPGMSGGGFWQSSEPQEGLWTPTDYRLIAIQSTW